MSNEIHVALPGGAEILRFTETVRIGRAETNGLVVDDDRVSAKHLERRKTDEGWEIVDRGSTNGTFIDDTPVPRAPVGARTTVRLGQGGLELRFTIPSLAANRGGRNRRLASTARSRTARPWSRQRRTGQRAPSHQTWVSFLSATQDGPGTPLHSVPVSTHRNPTGLVILRRRSEPILISGRRTCLDDAPIGRSCPLPTLRIARNA